MHTYWNQMAERAILKSRLYEHFPLDLCNIVLVYAVNPDVMQRLCRELDILEFRRQNNQDGWWGSLVAFVGPRWNRIKTRVADDGSIVRWAQAYRRPRLPRSHFATEFKKCLEWLETHNSNPHRSATFPLMAACVPAGKWFRVGGIRYQIPKGRGTAFVLGTGMITSFRDLTFPKPKPKPARWPFNPDDFAR